LQTSFILLECTGAVVGLKSRGAAQPSMSFYSEDYGRMSVESAAPNLSSNDGVPESEYDNVQPTLNFLSFALDSFIDALVDNISWYHEFAHFMNEQPHFYDRFNSRVMELCYVLMLPVAELGVCVTNEYVLGKLYTMESYLNMPAIPKDDKMNQIRSKGRGTSQQEFSRNLYLMGIIHLRILEHGLQGFRPVRKDEHERHRWKQM
jgi:hypothetical protein